MSKLTKALTAAAGNAGESLYAEDVFSTYLYTGNNTGTNTQNIVNGIDLSGEGGMVWIKTRNVAWNHGIWDTETDGGNLYPNTTDAQQSSDDLASFNSDGFGVSSAVGTGWYNSNNQPQASWTFRKAEKFFDVVTWTGSNDSGTDIGKGIVPHNLGVAPAVVIVKNTTQASTNWIVYHKDQTTGYYSVLNSTVGQTNSGSVAYFSKYIDGVGWQQTNPDADNIYIGYNYQTNGNTDTMVAYLFASDAGGFGDDGSESIIKCGSYVGTNASQEIDLGWEPQFVIAKRVSTTGLWYAADSMRGEVTLSPNSSNAEDNNPEIEYTARGFRPKSNLNVLHTYIYIAIRRPMKTPESGTEVFSPVAITAATGTKITTGFPVDWQIVKDSRAGANAPYAMTRLTGVSTVNTDQNGGYLRTNSTAAELVSNITRGWDNTGYKLAGAFGGNDSIYWNFKRATGFFDVVAYTATPVSSGQTDTEAHNLGVAPELIIVKNRTGVGNIWMTYHENVGINKYLKLETSEAVNTGNWSFPVLPTPSEFTTGWAYPTGSNLIAYLFATLAGVSKVGSYTGTGADLNVDCGFSAGARFILIKRTDSTGDWYVWDSVRGIVAGNDPYLLLNSTAAEVTSTDYIDPLASGFTVTSSAPAALNASGGSYIFLAIS